MDALGNELNRLLVGTYRAAGKIEQVMLEDLSDGKLTLSEMRAIECVGGGRQKGRTVTEISQDLDITLPSVTAMVKRLEQKGYVVKQRSEADGRQVPPSVSWNWWKTTFRQWSRSMAAAQSVLLSG